MIGDIFDLLDLSDTEWQERAVCPETDPAVFYPHEGSNGTQAKSVCAVCPVTAECLESALQWEIQQAQEDLRYTYGIWGGKTPSERRAILRERRAALNENEGDAA